MAHATRIARIWTAGRGRRAARAAYFGDPARNFTSARKIRIAIPRTGPKPVGGWRGSRARIFGQGSVPQAKPVDTVPVVRKRAPQRSVLRGGGAPAVDADTKCRRSTPVETETTKPARGDGEAVTDPRGRLVGVPHKRDQACRTSADDGSRQDWLACAVGFNGGRAPKDATTAAGKSGSERGASRPASCCVALATALRAKQRPVPLAQRPDGARRGMVDGLG
jgi:hypothetical protein